MLAQATLTFVAWNFLLGPIIFSRMDTPTKRRAFLDRFTSFRLTQLHVCNILLAAAQGLHGSPKRTLHERDMCTACWFVLGYAFWYLFVLDRLGIHLYLIYSPRTLVAVVSWTMTALAVGGCYIFWRYMIQQYGTNNIITSTFTTENA